MAKTVKCKFCGRSFELQRKNYQLGNRYVCVYCAQKYNSRIHQAKRENNLRRFGMSQSWGAMFLKLFLGIILLAAMITEKFVSPALLVIAIILLLSAIIPFLRRKKVKETYNNK